MVSVYVGETCYFLYEFSICVDVIRRSAPNIAVANVSVNSFGELRADCLQDEITSLSKLYNAKFDESL